MCVDKYTHACTYLDITIYLCRDAYASRTANRTPKNHSFVYLYIHMYVCIYVHIYMCIHIYIYTCTYVFVVGGSSGLLPSCAVAGRAVALRGMPCLPLAVFNEHKYNNVFICLLDDFSII